MFLRNDICLLLLLCVGLVNKKLLRWPNDDRKRVAGNAHVYRLVSRLFLDVDVDDDSQWEVATRFENQHFPGLPVGGSFVRLDLLKPQLVIWGHRRDESDCDGLSGRWYVGDLEFDERLVALNYRRC